ncbi:MAG: hypothetical protein IJ833_09825 [Lachnospiraceae bacterium]|nr:hypothetical protein [Lachnospiraceae bacterium]
MDGLELIDAYHVPIHCEKCSGVMVYQGVGEYKCERCGFIDYDDYGKVRCYIEKRKGATAMEVEAATGVSQRTIRRMLKDARIEVANDSQMFLRCELCGKSIRSGRYCAECEMKVHRKFEDQQRAAHLKNMQEHTHVYGSGHSDEGHRRFVHDKNQ